MPTASPNQPSSDYAASLAELGRSAEENTALRELHESLASHIRKLCRHKHPTIVGIAGSQGSGKSTHSSLLKTLLEREHGLRTCILSIDDVYLAREQRRELSENVHPLLVTRGVPATHDIALAQQTLDALSGADENTSVALPRFDKAIDDPQPRDAWPKVSGPIDVVLFEGWCMGARPQPAAALIEPINPLEAQEDPDGRWRQHVNDALAGAYSTLFGRLDMLIMLAAPSFEVVFGWRTKQEDALRARTPPGRGTELMDENALERFIMHYERITRAMLEELPAYADCVVRLSEEQQPISVSWKSAT